MSLRRSADFPADLTALAETAKALAHPARLRILQFLAGREECICGDIVEALPLAQATVSQHLKELRQAGLVRGAISGPRTCYCLDREAVSRAADRLAGLLADCCRTKGSDDEGCC